MSNIRDWCISRQIWWGHRIPVFYCGSCGHEWAAKKVPVSCEKCGDDSIRQDEDVLDTWFSSWLWPFSTFGWPGSNDDLKFYYPTHDLVTASEIIFFWVARMIMAGLEFMGDIPFRQVYIHGTVRDNKGLKMSKSLGNSIDPLTIIEKYNADALRFSLMMITATGQDVYLSDDKFEIGRNFGTKLWNAARFMKMHMDKYADDAEQDLLNGEEQIPDPESLRPDDIHILAKLQDAIKICTENLEKYRFNDAAHVLYEFIWHNYCDWYVECSKDILYGENIADRKQVLSVMNYIFSASLKLLHPMMPFITEELWSIMNYSRAAVKTEGVNGFKTIMTEEWPVPENETVAAKWGLDQRIVEYVDDKHDLIRVARTLKSDYGIPPADKVTYYIKPHTAESAELLKQDLDSIKILLRAEALIIDPEFQPENVMASGISKQAALYMPLEGHIDVEAEMKRLLSQRDKAGKELKGVRAKLENMDFVNKAPSEVIERQKKRKEELLEKSEKLSMLLNTLSNL
jgi:valyl-tRNA synthetase